MLLFNDYFAHQPVNDEVAFHRRFKMNRGLFQSIVHDVREYDEYFEFKSDCTGLLGFSSIQKCSVALQCLAYGALADSMVDYFRIAESTASEATYRFCKAVNAVFGPTYLRAPNAQDNARLLAVAEARGFPEMLRSIDCMHWKWKNCTYTWQGMYKGGHLGACSIVLEVLADYDTWIWHAFFDMADAHNDINMLQHSPVFSRLANGQAPECNYEINSHQYNMGSIQHILHM